MYYDIRNIAIIAHVDHGKTTLVDALLHQSGVFRENQKISERVMDSNDLEKERGITITSKNCAVNYLKTHINIIDTPGHSDFGGEVERILSMVDSVLLLVDAVDGTMPQTRFVTKKVLSLGIKPIVVINKIDRHDARINWAVNKTFDLFCELGANEEQLDFPIVYTSAINGYASLDPNIRTQNMNQLFDTIIKHVPVKKFESEGPLQLQIASLDYSNYVGRIGIGRILKGNIKSGQQVIMIFGINGKKLYRKVGQVFSFKGVERIPIEYANAGSIVSINGIQDIGIGATICSLDMPDALPMISVDEPTLTMNFLINSSPLSGSEGKFITSREIKNRLNKELNYNVALRVKDTNDESVFEVSGRGELHLSILIENMRREGYEFSVSRPRVILKEINGIKNEPYELLIVDIERNQQGYIMEEINRRYGEIINIISDKFDRIILEYRIPTRGLIGFQSEFLSITKGNGVISHIFESYAPIKNKLYDIRRNGVLISQKNGTAVAYSLWKLQDRGKMFVKPGDILYEGMIIGIHSRNNDLIVNPVKCKQLTNIRASGNDESIRLIPPIELSIEYAISFIKEDELVEVTPKSIRLRKKYLKDNDRRRINKKTLLN